MLYYILYIIYYIDYGVIDTFVINRRSMLSSMLFFQHRET